MQALKDEVVRGVFCASFVVRSSIGKFFADKKGCQDSEMSGASRIKRKWQHQTKMSRARNVKDKDFQAITQSTAVPARGAIPIGSPL